MNNVAFPRSTLFAWRSVSCPVIVSPLIACDMMTGTYEVPDFMRVPILVLVVRLSLPGRALNACVARTLDMGTYCTCV